MSKDVVGFKPGDLATVMNKCYLRGGTGGVLVNKFAHVVVISSRPSSIGSTTKDCLIYTTAGTGWIYSDIIQRLGEACGK